MKKSMRINANRFHILSKCKIINMRYMCRLLYILQYENPVDFSQQYFDFQFKN